MSRYLLILLACLAHEAMADAASLRVARYSTLEAVADYQPVPLLAVIVDANFPASVATLGEAFAHTLLGSGYRLIEGVPDGVPALMALPLPDSQRALGAMRLSRLLEVLVGPAHTLIVDRAHRLIAIEPCPYAAMRARP